MKKIFRTLICCVIAAAMIVFSCGAVFAGDQVSLDDLAALFGMGTTDETTDDGTGSESDLAAFLQALAALSGDQETEGEITDGVIDVTEYEAGEATIVIPSDWEVELYDGSYEAVSSDYTSFLSAAYLPYDGEVVDLTDEAQIDEFITSLGEDMTVNNRALVTVSGQTALWMEAESTEEDLTMTVYMLVLCCKDGGIYYSYGSLAKDEALFASLVNGINVDGGETDLSAAYTGELLPLSVSAGTTDVKTHAAVSADAPADAIDGSTGEEIVLVDNDDVTVSIKKITKEDDSYYAYKWKIFVENKTDLNLYVTTKDSSVNGIMLNPWWGTTVSAGHKTNSELTFTNSELESIKASDINNFEFKLTVRDDDDWSAENIFEGTFNVYPNGLDAEPQAAPDFGGSEVVLVDNDVLSMVAYDTKADDYYTGILVYIQNKLDAPIEISVSGDTSVNGYEISPYFYYTLSAGKAAYSEITWYNDDLADNDIDVIEEVELDTEVSNPDDWSADPYYEDVIYLTFE